MDYQSKSVCGTWKRSNMQYNTFQIITPFKGHYFVNVELIGLLRIC